MKNKIAIQLLPVTPVLFSQSPLIAYGRIAGYGILSYALYKKSKKLSYVFAGAASLSLLTSLTGDIVNSENNRINIEKSPEKMDQIKNSIKTPQAMYDTVKYDTVNYTVE